MTTQDLAPETTPASPTPGPAPDPAPDPGQADFGLADLVTEELLLLGAGSTVMYQLAMKGVGLGVAEHSTTLSRPVDRLRTTLTYVYVVTLGTEEEKQKLVRMVNRAHAPVRSPGRYTAFDPDLQLWVAATLARNGEQMWERVFGPMTPATRERVYRESHVFGTALQVDPSTWPPTRAAFEDYWEQGLRRLEADPQVQCYAKLLLSRRSAPLFLRALLPMQDLMTRGNLDPRTREVLALPWSARDQRRYDRVWRVVRAVYPRVPRPLRTAHARLVLAGFRWRLRTGRRVV